MAVAKRVFRADVKAWLEGIAGVASAVGSRVYAGIVPTPYQLPLVVIANEWRPVTQYNAPAWQGILAVNLYGSTTDSLDAIEDAIEDDMHRDPGDGTLEAELSSSGETKCIFFGYTRTGPDTDVYEVQHGSNVYGYTLRIMEFEFTLIESS